MDLIDRQEAIDAFDSYILDETTDLNGNTVREVLEKIPSAQPERKKGKWEAVLYHISDDGNELYEHYCSICKKAVMITSLKTGRFPFCPNCGADMRGGDDA